MPAGNVTLSVDFADALTVDEAPAGWTEVTGGDGDPNDYVRQVASWPDTQLTSYTWYCHA